MHGNFLWMLLLAALVVKIGMGAMQPKVVPMKKLFIMPAVLLVMALDSFHGQAVQGHVNIVGWIAGGLLGAGVGWKVALSLNLAFDHTKSLVRLPGGWNTLLLLLVIVAGKFIVGYEMGIHQGDDVHSTTMLLVFAVSGFCTGILVGRVGGYFYQFSRSSSVDLEMTDSR